MATSIDKEWAREIIQWKEEKRLGEKITTVGKHDEGRHKVRKTGRLRLTPWEIWNCKHRMNGF